MVPIRQEITGGDFGHGNPIDPLDERLKNMGTISIDEVIVAGWRVLETDFNEKTFQEWRLTALDCVVALCGESHPYTDYFRAGVQQARTSNVLTGVGLLVAAQSSEGTIGDRKSNNACAADNSTAEIDATLSAI